MDFFQSLFALQVQGDWNITISTAAEGSLVVAVLLKNEGCGDDARHVIPPIILKGTPVQMDEGFFEAVTTPVAATAQLFTNMEAYVKQQEQAQLQSKQQQDRDAKDKTQKDEKKKKYDEQMKKVGELEAEGKFREAWCKVPDPNEYSGFMDAIRKRKEELAAKFGQASLFDEQP